MERRQFIALLALSLVPSSAGAAEGDGSRLVELQAQLRDKYGEKTDQIMRTAREEIRETVRQNPDLRTEDELDLELLTEIAFRRTLDRLRADGVTLSTQVATTEGEG